MSRNKPVIAEDWYHQSFDALYPIVYAHRTVDSARAEALFSVEQTQLMKSDTVLDLCCGNGRHIAHLLPHTSRVVGLDFSPHLLHLARKTLQGKALLVRADMRRQPFDGVFDVVMNYFTSFGYFQSEEENLAVVYEMSRSLKSGGRFFIDYLNRNWAEAHVEPESVRYQDEYEIREERWIDTESHRINKTTIVSKDGKRLGESGESVKLYTLDEITGLLNKGGLQVESVYGDYSGSTCCDPSQPRMIIVGRKG